MQDNVFEKHPVITNLVLIAFIIVLIELLMHGLYALGLLPRNPIYMTPLEKADYRPNLNEIIYEDGVPRRAAGYTTYSQRGIPPQYIQFDDKGMRIDAYAGEDPADKIIGVFGDSYTDALQVGQLESWAALLESRLRDAGCAVDVRNYGLGATGTSVQYLRYLQRKAAGEHFDLVILALFQNDILNNSFELDQLFPKSYLHYPYFKLEDGELVRQDWSQDAADQSRELVESFLYRYSHLANTIFNLKMLYQASRRAAMRAEAGNQLKRQGSRVVMDRLYGPPDTDTWRDAWKVTEELIRMWDAQATAAGEKFLLVLLTESVQLQPDPADSDLDYDYPNRRLARFSEEHKIPVFDFLPPARNYVRQNNLEFPYLSWEHDGHYSQLGNSLLAGALQPGVASALQCRSPGGP